MRTAARFPSLHTSPHLSEDTVPPRAHPKNQAHWSSGRGTAPVLTRATDLVSNDGGSRRSVDSRQRPAGRFGWWTEDYRPGRRRGEIAGGAGEQSDCGTSATSAIVTAEGAPLPRGLTVTIVATVEGCCGLALSDGARTAGTCLAARVVGGAGERGNPVGPDGELAEDQGGDHDRGRNPRESARWPKSSHHLGQGNHSPLPGQRASVDEQVRSPCGRTKRGTPVLGPLAVS